MLSGQLARLYLSLSDQIRPSGEARHLLEGLTFQARKLGASEMKCHVRDPWKLDRTRTEPTDPWGQYLLDSWVLSL